MFHKKTKQNLLICLPWAGTVEEHLFQFLATLEDVVDGLDSHNGFVEAVAPAAMAAVRVHMDQSVPMHQPAGWDEVTGQLGMGDLEAMHGHSHCSEGTVREDIQDPESRNKTNVSHSENISFAFKKRHPFLDLKNKNKITLYNIPHL